MTFSGYLNKRLEERDVVNIITSFKFKGNDLPDITPFYNLLFDPVRFDGIEEYQGFYVGTNLERTEFDLQRQGKNVVPGDFDIIFIPYNQDLLFYDRTSVFEVKVARPHIRKGE